jgi:hypothetical protein
MKALCWWHVIPMLFVMGLPTAGFARSSPVELWQETLFAALKAQHLVDPDRQLLQIHYVCTMKVARSPWAVVDMFEITHNPGETSPKGVNTILVLDQQFHVIRKMTRPSDARPLFCRGNTLYLDADDFDADNGDNPGNAIAFQPDHLVHVSVRDRAALPVPLTSRRHHYRLP